MDRKKFEDIKSYCEKEKFDHLVGWAVWNEDEDQLDDLSMFNESNLKETIARLKDDIVIMGLNASNSAEIREETWAGFHNKHQGGRDSWLRELVRRHPILKGAYMTDVFKFVESESEKVKEEYREEKKRIKEYEKLKKELSILGNNLTIILVGDDAEKYFKMFEEESDRVGKHRLFKIPHYAGRITQDDFFAESEKGLKKEITDQKYSTVLGL